MNIQDENEKVISFLCTELERVDKWLSFGEAKNAALVAMNIAVLSVGVEFKCKSLFLGLRICVVISMLIALLSFWPIMVNKASAIRLKCMKVRQSGANYLFFSDIATLNNGKSYLDIVKNQYIRVEFDTTEKYKVDLADEIVVNSRIAVVKYGIFRIALVIDIIAISLMAILFLFD